MLYLVLLILFLGWSVYVIRKENMSWHTVISIYVVTLFAVDYGDVPFDFWFDFYDLPVHLLNNLDVGHYLGIILSDGIIFPLIAIIFCYYSAKYKHPWLLSILFASIIGVIEFVFVKFGYMVYKHWNHWLTPVLVFVSLRILANFAVRLINYSPPVSYKFRLLCSIYAIVEWPGAILAGAMKLIQYKPNIFANETADNRFVAMILTTLMGGIAAIFITRIPQRYRIALFLGLGICSSIFALWMHLKGMLVYYHWNSLLMVIRYLVPYLFVYFYDRWESAYTRQFKPEHNS